MQNSPSCLVGSIVVLAQWWCEMFGLGVSKFWKIINFFILYTHISELPISLRERLVCFTHTRNNFLHINFGKNHSPIMCDDQNLPYMLVFFCRQAPVAYLRQLRITQGLHSFFFFLVGFVKCSSVTSENCLILAWFLESPQALQEHGPFMQPPEAAWQHTPFLCSFQGLWKLHENSVCFWE